ncbi:MAG: iron-containing alcohol dehydrogenase family protein [Tissierellia bacterium]|nr:iron-containing alcohol dehydrogenase family protein [Tissierellia bacterium]
MKTIKMTNYSFSQEGYPQLAEICKEYGYHKVVLVGGEKAMKAATPKIRKALEGSTVEITGELVYGKECTDNNIDRLLGRKEVQISDVIFTIGGGKAMDTGKVLAYRAGKQTFTFPTICSNCAAVTAIAVVYHEDGSLSHYEQIPAPAHMFVDTEIIAQAPDKYMWAGVGDGLSKQVEVEFATQGAEDLDHTARTGLMLSKSCQDAFLTYGEKAIDDVKNNINSRAVEEVAMTILVNTGYVSNLTNQPEYYYNSSLAHIFYNVSTAIPREGEHLHGAVVALGVMVLHAYNHNLEELERIATFNKRVGLPITLDDIGLEPSDIEKMVELAPNTNEWKWANPPLSKEKLTQAIFEADAYGKKLYAIG